jgi:S-layer protein (TIGR01567 family)
MVNKKTIRGIAFVVLMLSIVLIAMAAAPELTTITVSPTTASKAVGATQTFTAAGFDQNGTTITISPAEFWSSSNITVGTIDSASGVFTALAAGTTNITATNGTGGTVSGNASVTVTLTLVLTTITVSPATTSNAVGTTQTFTAAGFDQNSASISISPAAFWTSSNATVGTIDSATGVFTALAVGTTNITATNGTGGTVSGNASATVTPSLGAGSVSGLSVAARGATWINWTWTNPGGNFNHTMVSINGTFQTNTSDNFYNYTSFGVGTSNTISLHTVDTSGNVNSTAVSNQSSTMNTQGGSNVIYSASGANITFSQLNGDGMTSVTVYPTFQSGLWGTPTFTAVGSYYDVSLTGGTPSGNITVDVGYTPPSNENLVRLYHWDGTSWVDVTTSRDTTAHRVSGNATVLSPFVPGIPPAPVITKVSPSTDPSTTGRSTQTFDITVSQIANVTWTIGSFNQTNLSLPIGTHATLVYTLSIPGNYTISVNATNANGTDIESWNWTVHPKTYASGNRIWDGGRPTLFSLTYTWNPMSFSGFYYDIDSDVGNESITMTMNGYADRTVNKGNIVYATTPEEVAFGYSPFGNYSVIGFMAEKYFAGYTANSKVPGAIITVGAKSTLGQRQLHKVLFDDDTKRTISVGSTLTLKEGYVLKAKDISTTDRIMLVSLLKDGNEVDTATLTAGQTYVYAPSKVGAITDLPIIMVRFDSVFSGTEVQAAFLKGIFQISSSPTTLKTGDMYNDMKVTTIGQDKIEMKNDADVTLSKGNTEDLMGDIKILVADNDTLRFALSTEKTGIFEVRSTVYRGNDPNTIDTWNPYNFGMNLGKTSVGFYYDLDDGIGNESLRLVALTGNTTGSVISAHNLVYTTTPEEVSFGYSAFGSYQVIGFMADKYFAGYTASSIPAAVKPIITVGAKSTIGQRQLHKVLIDDDTKRTISVGSTLTLKEGYVLKAKDISTTDRIMLVSLLKDGTEVDTVTLQAGETYVYAPSKVGVISDLPIIMVRFDSVFSGTEVQAAFLKGIFQISSSPTTLKTGDMYDDMKVTTVGQDKIEMNNENDISLDNGKVEELMGNIKLKVGDTTATDNALRFYFAVDVTPEMVANQLVIDAPAQANAGEVLNIKVTAGGNPLDGVSVAINSVDAGQTDKNGLVNYTLPRTLKGNYNITATKLGYQQATKGIEILQYIDNRLSILAPATANQFSTITIKITYNGSAISGATVGYDNATIGTTDSNGVLNYTLQTSGTHTISVAKSGYVAAIRDINVRAPFSQYQALDINIIPGTVSVNEPALIRSNITNVGTKADTLPVELVSNGTVVDNKTVSLAPGEIKEINFSRKEALPGNYTIEIMGQKGILEVKEQSLSLLLVGGIATVIGLIAIYLLTAKGLLGNLLGKFKGLGGIKK